MPRPLSIYMPGAFANLGERLRAGWADAEPAIPLAFHRFIPSGDLAALILGGAEADVYVSANTTFMDKVAAAGLAIGPRLLAGNALCIILRPGAERGIEDARSLIASPLRIVTPQPETDPCGRYISDLFARLGLADAIAARMTAGTLLHSHGSGDLPGFLDDGRVDAGILYRSETGVLRDRWAVVELPPDQDCHEYIQFVISAIRREDQIHPAAERFVAWMTGRVGQKLLTEAGFVGESTE